MKRSIHASTRIGCFIAQNLSDIVPSKTVIYYYFHFYGGKKK